MEMGKLCRKIQSLILVMLGLRRLLNIHVEILRRRVLSGSGAQERDVGWKYKFGNCGHRSGI